MADKDVIFTVDESLWQQAKIEAARQGITLKEFVTEAIKRLLDAVGK
jgi:predicted HicB family RNase H-like nuclease